MRKPMILTRLLLCAALVAGPVAAQAPVAAAQTPMYGGPDYGSGALAPCTRRTEVFPRGKAINIDFSTDIRQASVTDPATADVRLSTPRRVSIVGIAVGQTDASFYDSLGRCILIVDIRVEQDVSGAADLVRRLLPDSNVQIQAAGQSIILSGSVASAADRDKVAQIASQYVARPEQVLNWIATADSDQVQLNVRVVEVNRTVIKQLGFDLNALIGQVGGGQLSFSNAAGFAVNGGLMGGLTGGYQTDTTQQPMLEIPCAAGVTGTCYEVIRPGQPSFSTNPDTATARPTVGSDGLNKANAVIKAFERAGLLRILSEPNLSSVSGEGATFLAGGEYPVPSGRDNNGNVTVEFKSYGVGLGFTPVVLSGGRISLKMSVEVSDLTTAGALTLTGVAGSGSSTIIPALSVRRVQNTIELPSGGSMMIAGLLQDSTRQNIDKIPGVADVPVFGALARSRDFLKNETELVVIATPYLIRPVRPGSLQTPADGLRIASDTETTLLGRLNQAYTDPAGPAPSRSYQGPIGHVIE
jgi:pilus assembly protein CpaC